MPDTEAQVERETLYEEVWREPVKVVAERYGLSDVGLAKVCKRLHIPIPSRGYWAKVQAGRVMRKVPLPPLPTSIAVPRAPAPLTTEERQKKAAIKQSAAKAKESLLSREMPKGPPARHPLVQAASRRLHPDRGWSTHTGLRSAPQEVLNLEVTKGSLERALTLADTLLKALEATGISVSIDSKKGETILDSAGLKIDFKIVEKIARTAHVATPAEVRAMDRYRASFRSGKYIEYPRIPEFDYSPTGKLTVSVGRGRRRNWNDTSLTSLDDRIQEIRKRPANPS